MEPHEAFRLREKVAEIVAAAVSAAVADDRLGRGRFTVGKADP